MKSYIYFPLLFLYSLSFSQTGKLSPAIIANIQQRIESGTNPGVVIGIIDKEGSHYYSFGKKKKGGKKVNEHSIYEIGSISKVFTTTLLADQIVKGELSSEDPIDKFLPAYVHFPKWNDQQITLGQLADHTSSLPRLPGNFTPADPANPYADYSAEKMHAFLSGYKLAREPGSEYEYSNLAVGLLGHILSMNAGKTYEDLISSTITGPLKMNETKIRLTRKMKKNLQQDIMKVNLLAIGTWERWPEQEVFEALYMTCLFS